MAKKTAKRVKHVPQRTCVGCRQILAKRALIRVVRTPEGLRVDPTGKLPGRGAYLHDRRACWELGLKGGLAHALKVELTEPDRAALLDFMATLPEDTLLEEAPLPTEEPLPAEEHLDELAKSQVHHDTLPKEAERSGGKAEAKAGREQNVGKRTMTR